jgi:hypothetical protein
MGCRALQSVFRYLTIKAGTTETRGTRRSDIPVSPVSPWFALSPRLKSPSPYSASSVFTSAVIAAGMPPAGSSRRQRPERSMTNVRDECATS